MFDWFWNPDVWLPPNIDWETFKAPRTVNDSLVIQPEQFAVFSDLLFPLPLAVCLILLRLLVEATLFRPVGRRLGLQERAWPAARPGLEQLFSSGRRVAGQALEVAAQQDGLTVVQADRWLRARRRATKPSTLDKFCETGWRWLFYTTILGYGLAVLIDKPWLADIHQCWVDYPYHTVDLGIWIYYMLELAFYWSLSITQWFDVKRKDFWQMFIHHNTTIALMMFSWSTHFVRVGTLVLVLHDSSDHLLELAKLLKYLNFKKSCDAVFVVFTLVWTLTRCFIFPLHILRSTLKDAEAYIEMFPFYYVFNFLLCLLQILNIVWTFYIYKVVFNAVLSKSGVEDSRSDSEEDSQETDDSKKND